MKTHILHATASSWSAHKLSELAAANRDMTETFDRIEALAAQTNAAGAMPLWEGYAKLRHYPAPVGKNAARHPNQVRTSAQIGRFFTSVVTSYRPAEIIEIGGAFGVSGMYWGAGLQRNGFGCLTSFEANPGWARFAAANIAQIHTPSRVIAGPFEDNQAALPETIDIAFVDAIHTPEFVLQQLGLILDRAAPGALILLDDIHFSDPMARLWRDLREDPGFAAAVEVNARLGLLELPRP